MIASVRAEDLFPRFLFRDRNGLAACRAVEAGLNYFLETAGGALAILEDIDSMPEWRLDEMAWELNCIYDDTASVERKRKYIRDSWACASIQGTVEAVRRAVSDPAGKQVHAEVEEWFAYGSYPYYFRLVTDATGETLTKLEALALAAANLRSVMGTTVRGLKEEITVTDHADLIGGSVYPYCGIAVCIA